MTDSIKAALQRYDELSKLVLEQKLDELSDNEDAIPEDIRQDEYSYEAYITRVVSEETAEQTRLMENEPVDVLDGKSMKECFETLSFDELTEILEYCALELDREAPESLIEVMASESNGNRDKVKAYAEKIINESAWIEEEMTNEDSLFEMEFTKAKNCFALLIKTGDESLVTKVLDRFISYPQTRDFVADSMALYVQAFPEVTVPYIITKISENKQDGLEGPFEDLVIILGKIGNENPSDEIFLALKDAFRSMTNKIYGVICLADYGDGRAVPLLKGYVNRHQDDISRELFYEIMSSIQKLGGDIADITDPFGDFRKQSATGEISPKS